MKRFKYTNGYIDNGEAMKATQEEQAREEERFTSIVRDIARTNGYPNVSVEIVDFTDFKVRWARTYDTIRFTVSDYLIGVPDSVFADIMRKIFTRIDGISVGFSESTNEYLTDAKFANAHRRTYLSRLGAERVKYTSFNGVPVHFSKNPMGRVGGASVLMKVIVLDPSLKKESEDFVLNAIKCKYNDLQMGLENFGKKGELVQCDRAILREAGYGL